MFLAPGGAADAFELVRLAHRLGPHRPVLSVRSPVHDRRVALPDRTVERMADRGIKALRSLYPRGPYAVGGYSAGGSVALEMAHRLRAAGEDVVVLALLDGVAPLERPMRLRPWRTGGTGRDGVASGQVPGAPPAPSMRPLRGWVAHRTLGLVPWPAGLRTALVFSTSRVAVARYRGVPYGGPAVVLGSSTADEMPPWDPWLTGDVVRARLPGDHATMLREPHVGVAGATLAGHLDAFDQRASAGGGPRPVTREEGSPPAGC